MDAEYKFIAIDVGSYGREGDAGIFLKSKIGKSIPATICSMYTNNNVPHVIVGDEAFALHENLMKPYPRRQTLRDPSKAVYNYRLSRARRTTENAFAILSAYFRVFFQPIATTPETTDKLIVSACILHNIPREAKIMAPTQQHFDEAPQMPTENLLPLTGNNVRASHSPNKIRNAFRDYFNGLGAVEWQNNQATYYYNFLI